MAKEVPELNWFRGRASYLQEQHKDRNELFEGTDKMINLEWDLPDALNNLGWVFKQVTVIFRQVVAAASRILADVRPDIHVTPYTSGAEAGKIADLHERALGWLLDAASRRRSTTVVQDVVESAIRYSEVAQQVIFLPVQQKSVEASGGNKDRYDAVQRRGPFVVITHNPKNVFARHSDVGLEEVALVVEMDPHEIVDIYGEKASDLKDYIMENNDAEQPLRATLIDYVSYDYRAVFVDVGQETSQGQVDYEYDDGNTLELVREKWGWPFLPWVERIGGSNLEQRSDRKRRTLLSDAYYSEAFDTMNRVKTLRFSEMIRYAGSPKKAFQSDQRTSPGIDASSGDLVAHVYEDEQLRDLNPPVPDPSMGTLHQELRAEVQKSTLSEILFGGDIPQGAAFATINLVTHSALAVLKPTRILAEDSIADLCEIFLLWAHYTKTDLSGYGTEPDNQGIEYLIEWKDIQPANLYIDVDLHADVPTDRQQRMLTAINGVQAGLISRRDAREDVGQHDTQATEERIIQEQVFDTLLQTELENLQKSQSDAFMQQLMMQARQQVQAQMQMAQQQQAGIGSGDLAGLGAPTPGRTNRPSTGMGDLATPPQPNQGGPVPAELSPNATRELQTGQTQSGEEVAEV